MVSHDQIINAQQAYSISTSVTNIFGPALGGILLSLGKGGGSHEEIAFLFNVISFIPLLACIPSLPLTKFSKESKSKKTGIIQSALDGIKFVRKERDIRILLMLLAFVMLLGMPFQALLPVFVRTHLNPESGHVFYASLLSAVSLGGFCSSLIGFKEGTMSRPGLLLIIASLTLGISILVLVSSGIIHWASLAAFFAGAGGTLVINYDNALIEKNTPMELQGRIASIASLTKGLQAFSVAAAGYLMHILSHAPSSTTSGYLEVQVSLAIVLLLSVCMMAPSLYKIRQTQASS
jgi:MFS family permease